MTTEPSTARERLAAHLYRQAVASSGEPHTAWEFLPPHERDVWLRAADDAITAMGS